MKKWYIGIDGGGTKTAFVIAQKDGKIIANFQTSGCSHLEIGVDAVIQLITEGIMKCLDEVGATKEECGGVCLGLPCYGEDAQADQLITEQLGQHLSPMPIQIVNDVEVGWAGALECTPGIHIVSGTGSIAFGKNEQGISARCGGWSEFFGDEGSCYWVGKEAMGLFSKEADGRIPRGALYEIVKKELHLEQDLDFINVVLQEFMPYRDRVASFQRIACQAALANDVSAIQLYKKAAKELAMMVSPLKESLGFSTHQTQVSYSGGLFKTGDLILEPLSYYLKEINCVLVSPKKTPVEGALLMAIQKFCC